MIIKFEKSIDNLSRDEKNVFYKILNGKNFKTTIRLNGRSTEGILHAHRNKIYFLSNSRDFNGQHDHTLIDDYSASWQIMFENTFFLDFDELEIMVYNQLEFEF
jgi:hypothetical protein